MGGGEKPQGRGCYENLQNLGFLLIENVSKIRYIAVHILAILGARVCENQAFLARSFSVLQYDDDSIENITKKSEFASFQTLSRLFGTSQFVKCRRLFLELNS